MWWRGGGRGSTRGASIAVSRRSRGKRRPDRDREYCAADQCEKMEGIVGVEANLWQLRLRRQNTIAFEDLPSTHIDALDLIAFGTEHHLVTVGQECHPRWIGELSW